MPRQIEIQLKIADEEDAPGQRSIDVSITGNREWLESLNPSDKDAFAEAFKVFCQPFIKP